MEVVAEAQVLPHQLKFIQSTAIHPALVGGFGSGKTEGGLRRGMALKTFPTHKLAVYAPTFRDIRDIWWEKFIEFNETFQLRWNLNKQYNVMTIQNFGRIFFRSMKNPEYIVGYDAHDSIIDELDILPPDKAAMVWNKVIARNRAKRPDGKPNTTGVTTTPEGFKFTYEKFVKKASKITEIIHASTYDNPFLPEDYISTLKDSYDPLMLDAYLNGRFVNLTKGAVYYAFKKQQHQMKDLIPFDPTLPLCVCVDFNVNPMSWVLVQFRSRSDVRIIAEHVKPNTSTPDHCISLKMKLSERYPSINFKDVQCVVYGDAAGEHRDTRSTYTDYAIINEHLRPFFKTIEYKVPASNPPVQSRVLIVNNLLSKEFVVKISRDVIELVDDFSQIVYTKDGDIDKSNAKRTHTSDAFGYLAAVEFPIVHSRTYGKIRSI